MNILKSLSLRTKLVVLYSGLLILSVGFVIYYSYWNIWELLVTNKATHLRARAKPIIEHWIKLNGYLRKKHNISPSDAQTLAYDLTSRDSVAIILNREGKIIANGRRLPEEPSPPLPDPYFFKKALSGVNEVNYLKKINGEKILIFFIPLRPEPGSNKILGVIQISTPLSDVKEILFKHNIRQISAGAFILILGILFGYWLIYISLKELQNLSITCEEIAKGNFTKKTNIENRKDEVGKLSNSFNLMVDKLKGLFEAQKRFVSNAAHELLTPLTGLRGSLEVLLRGALDDVETVNRLCKGI